MSVESLDAQPKTPQPPSSSLSSAWQLRLPSKAAHPAWSLPKIRSPPPESVSLHVCSERKKKVKKKRIKNIKAKKKPRMNQVLYRSKERSF